MTQGGDLSFIRYSDEYNLHAVAVEHKDGCMREDSYCAREMTVAPLS